MADVLPLSTNFDLGFQSDTSRDELSVRAAYRMIDYIPELEAPLRKRGGWTYFSVDLSSLGGTTSAVASIGWLPFAGDGHLVAVGDTGSVYSFRNDGTGAIVADTGDASIVPTWPVFWHQAGTDQMGVILGGLNQGPKNAKRYHDTGSHAYQAEPLPGANVPQARFGFSWGDYLVLGNYYQAGVLHNNSLAFPIKAGTLDYDFSATNASVMPFKEEVIAGLPVLNAILVWGYENCWLVTGSLPPPGGDMAIKMLFAGNGTFDGRSVTGWRTYAIWANNSGVWMSDGATLTDLTAEGGISLFYRDTVENLSFIDGDSAVGGIYRDHYVLSLRQGTQTVTLVCDLQRKVWTQWENIPVRCFAHRAAAPGTIPGSSDEELFFGCHDCPQVAVVSPLWDPTEANAADGDGLYVLPALETPFYRVGSLAYKRLRFMYAGYDLRTSALGTPAIQMSYVLDPEEHAVYTLMGSLPVTPHYRRRRVRLARPGLGFGLRLAQVGPSAQTRLYALEAETHPWEVSR